MARKLEVAAFGGQVDDAEAVLDYMKRTNAQTNAAATLKAQFMTWYSASSWYDKNFNSTWYDELRSRRNAFNLANAVTGKEKQAIQNVLERGMTAEEMQGKPRPAIDTKTGLVGTAIKNPPVGMVTAGSGFSRNLKKGVTPGDDIKRWQSFLGISPPTGYFDAVTDNKTRDYQKANGLTVDGIVGKNTWTAAFPIVKAEAPAAVDAEAFLASNIKMPSGGSSGSKPAAKPAAAKPAATKPASSGSGGASPAPAASVPVAQAGMIGSLSSITKWPLWAKVLGGVAAVGSVGALAFTEHKKIQDRS